MPLRAILSLTVIPLLLLVACNGGRRSNLEDIGNLPHGPEDKDWKYIAAKNCPLELYVPQQLKMPDKLLQISSAWTG